MRGDFLQNLYLMIGLFVALTTVILLFAVIGLRAIRRLADDIKGLNAGLKQEIRRMGKSVRRMEKGIRRDIRRMDEGLSGEFRGLFWEARKMRKGVEHLRKDMREVKDLLGIETESCPKRPRSGADDRGRGR